MSKQENMTGQQKLDATKQLLDFLEELLPPEHHDQKYEILMLAYHASTNTCELRRLISPV